jgi:hypothetical protein
VTQYPVDISNFAEARNVPTVTVKIVTQYPVDISNFAEACNMPTITVKIVTQYPVDISKSLPFLVLLTVNLKCLGLGCIDFLICQCCGWVAGVRVVLPLMTTIETFKVQTLLIGSGPRCQMPL